MEKEARNELWRARLADLSASNLTQKQWCERNGVPVHQVGYWKRQLGDTRVAIAGAADAGRAGVDWCPVQFLAPAPVPGLVVRIGAACIEVVPGFDPHLLAGVVRALAEVAEPRRGC